MKTTYELNRRFDYRCHVIHKETYRHCTKNHFHTQRDPHEDYLGKKWFDNECILCTNVTHPKHYPSYWNSRYIGPRALRSDKRDVSSTSIQYIRELQRSSRELVNEIEIASRWKAKFILYQELYRVNSILQNEKYCTSDLIKNENSCYVGIKAITGHYYNDLHKDWRSLEGGKRYDA